MSRTVISVIFMSMFVILVVGCNLDDSNPSAPPPPIPPEISVRQESTSLLDGSGEFVFENVILLDGNGGYCTENVIFTIENQGGENLSISGVALSAGDTEDFDLDTSSTASTLEPSYSTIFTICYDPLTSLGVRSAVVTISSNDEDEESYTFTVKGFGMKKCVASDGTAESWFGYRVTISGDTVVVSKPRYADGINWNQGAVYVFNRNHGGSDNWGEVKKLTVSDSTWFGWSVALDDDTLVAGGGSQAAYIFYRDHGGADNWGDFKKLTASDGDRIDGCVAIDVDTVVAGNPNNTIDSKAEQGSAYVFYRNHGGSDNWGEVKKLTASDGVEGDMFGVSMAIDGDIIVVGAYGVDAPYSGQGAAYVFYRNQGGPDAWGQVQKLTASDAAENDFFGLSVAVTGETVVVGEDLGSAYLFSRDHGGAHNWGQVKKLTISDYLRKAVAISGDTVVAGAYNSNNAQGAVYLFSRDQGGTGNWGQIKKLTASDGAQLDNFGLSVAFFADTMVIGAPYAGNQGAVYIYEQ